MKKRFVSAILCSSMLLGGAGLPVLAQEEMTPMSQEPYIVRQGEIGTAIWTIDSNGTLKIGEGEFEKNNSYYDWPWQDYLDAEVTQVDGTAAFKISGSLYHAFYAGLTNDNSIESINLSGWDTSEVTDMQYVFSECKKLTSLDLSGWNTSAVTDFDYMFFDCSSLTSLDLSSFDTSSATDISMFKGCSSLVSLDLSSFDTSKVTGMGSMFKDCSSLTSLDLSGFDTSAVTYMSDMFYGCSSLVSLDLSSFDTSKVTGMCSMFEGCSSLTSLDLSSFNTSKVDDMRFMFYGCSSLSSLDISNFDTTKVSLIWGTFGGCSSLTNIRYPETARNALSSLPAQSGWYQDGNGPYTVQYLPFVPEGKTALLTRKTSVSDAKVTGINASYVETGSALTPKPRVELNGKVLKEGTDYKLSYSSNIKPGKAEITITGIGDYEGTKTVSFMITKKPSQPAQKTSLSGAKVTGVSASYVETGSAIAPKPRVEVNGKALKEGTDYC